MRDKAPDRVASTAPANRLRPGSYFAGPADAAPLSLLRQHIEEQNRRN